MRHNPWRMSTRYRIGRRTDSGEAYVDQAALNQACRDYECSEPGTCSEPSSMKPPLQPYPPILDEAEYEAKYYQRSTFRLAVMAVKRGMTIRTYTP